MCSNSKFWSSMKLEFYEKWACSSTNIYMYTLFKWWEIHGSIHLKDANRDWYMYLDKKSFRLCSTWSQEKLLQSENTLHSHRRKSYQTPSTFVFVGKLTWNNYVNHFFFLDRLHGMFHLFLQFTKWILVTRVVIEIRTDVGACKWKPKLQLNPDYVCGFHNL